MNQITVNGKTYTAPDGHNISVTNGVVYIDGVRVTDKVAGTVEIVWRGPLANLTVVNGSVKCKEVHGSVTADGSVDCLEVKGDVRAGGSVNCGTVGGGVRAGGSVSHR